MGTSRSIGEKLLSMKKQLEEQKAQRSELQGELKSLTKQMEQEFGVKTPEEADAKIKEMETEIQGMEESLQQQVDKIEILMEGGSD